MTPETYCQECKQNVSKGASCANCGYEFVDPDEESDRTTNRIGLWYCPRCEELKPHHLSLSCPHCGRALERTSDLPTPDANRDLILIPRAELEELVGALEKASSRLASVCADAPIYGDPRHTYCRDASLTIETAAKFRAKYLGGDGELPSIQGLANFIWTSPLRNNNGALCGLCDGTDAHEHPQLQCAQCGVVGLSENMPRHKCKTKL